MYDESKSEPLTESDTANHTKFYATDEQADYDGTFRLDGTATYEQHYSRLAKLNTGIYNGKWADETERRRADKLALFDAVASQLELSPHQKRAGRAAFEDISLPEVTGPTIDSTLVAIMTAAVVARPDGRTYHPSRSDNTNDPLFTDLLSRFDYYPQALHQCYGKVVEALRF